MASVDYSDRGIGGGIGWRNGATVEDGDAVGMEEICADIVEESEVFGRLRLIGGLERVVGHAIGEEGLCSDGNGLNSGDSGEAVFDAA